MPIAALAVLALAGLAYRSLTAKPRQPVDPIAHGLADERAGHAEAAERDLLAAAAADHQYGPRWTLAGFYFRHNRPDDFWKWTRAALNAGTRDLGGLFDLCWFETTDSRLIWARAMPERKEIWNEYLSYLLAANHWEAAIETANRLAPRSTTADLPVLIAFCDVNLEKKDPGAAAPVWNQLCKRGLIDLKPLDKCHYLFNGDWVHKPSGRGLDWHLLPNREVRETWTPGELHLTFTGMQAEGVELLSQPLALPPGATYQLRYAYRGQPGIRWRIEIDGATAAESAATSFHFTMPATARAATLKLVSTGKAAGPLVLTETDVAQASTCTK